MPKKIQGYVCGFFFSRDRARVLLIRKNRPTWQAGKLNGVGGKIERGETPVEAMRREFREEAGLDVAEWSEIAQIGGEDWVGHFFRAYGEPEAARKMTDEALEIHATNNLPPDTIANLKWIVPLLLDDEVAAGQYGVAVYFRRSGRRDNTP